MKKKKIKFISAVNDIPNIINDFLCLITWKKLAEKFFMLFLFLFFGIITAQIFVGDSAVVVNSKAIVYSTTNKNKVTTENLETFIFISKEATFIYSDSIKNVNITYENPKKRNTISEPKFFAKTSIKRQNKIAKKVSTKNKTEKKSVLGYRNNENNDGGFCHYLSESFIALPNYDNHFKSSVSKDFTLLLHQLSLSYDKLNISSRSVNFQYYFLESHHNRPPPFLG